MKAVIGVDTEGNYRPTINLLARLGFPNCSAELFHVDELLLAGGAGATPFTYASYPTIDEVRREQGERLLGEAEALATAAGIESTTLYAVGNPCDRLMRRGDELHCDLIAVGSTHKSRYGAFFLGSVGRGLAIGAHQSVLVSKNDVEPTGSLTAVFATDGSDYADDCLRMLARMKPKGIRRLIIVSAVEALVDRQLPKEIAHHVDSLVSHLCEEGFEARGHVVEGSPSEVIDAMMKASKADLVILGAQGHGFVERLFVGSVALQVVVSSPYSVLLLRKP
ncbi:universal stress protein [Fimbriimonas ginsengisoli]|uniref:Putative universal stress protein UspA n=1 Tax=Fimbriimonas ginsengisoli Gsoil 348 TaxID=661478 RepID=A0A068NY29_FIMGI|nr:universal stress protein [Fimbriimonas ginsengisoli]AIE86589.1 putative universal stress protein UspA [Fimbriimonas ginsengisoli Gsoil 348]